MRRAAPFVSFLCLLLCLLCLLAVSLASPALAQGRTDYFNVESPQVHPIEVVRLAGHDYLLVCNTPDNSVEVWDTDETILPAANRFLARVAVGLEPVSVRWVPSRGRFYVANFLGDSLTEVVLAAPTGPSSLSALVVKTVPVTDEPMDIAFAPVNDALGIHVPTLFVTHSTLDAYGEYNAVTLAPVAAGSERQDAVVATGQDIDFDTQLDDIAVKAPRTLAVICDKLFVLGFLGGNTIRYDFDLYSQDLASGTAASLGGLGSTNWNLEFVDQNNLFITGAEALNTSLTGEAAVAAAPTGFVKNMFYWVRNPCSANPTVLARDVNLISNVQQEPGQPFPAPISSRGIAVGPQGATAQPIPIPITSPVAKGQALVQLTDLEALTDGVGAVDKVFFTAYGSDRVGVIEPRAAQSPINWQRRRININPVGSPAGSFVGPRGLALKRAIPGSGTDPGNRLYVVNRGESSVSILDPGTETVVGGFLLNNDPNPDFVTAGRKFLYSARLSGNGFDACASCHMDARTDGLAWNLSDGNDVTIPPELLPFPGFAGGEWDGQKGFIVTQSLQGLLNWGVPLPIQHLFTNAPYHWRGDRATFQSFNGAFASLLASSELAGDEIEDYEEFINTVHYPPNPQQPRNRVPSGVLGDVDDNDPSHDIDGSGALLGLKIYHTVNTDGFSCVGCHSMPVGSDNVLTEFIAGSDPHPVVNPPFANAAAQPIETAALRGLFQKEARLDKDGFSIHDNSPITGYEGMMHTGLTNPRVQASLDFNGTASLNAFNARFFSSTACVGPGPAICANLQALNQFIHEFDFGSSPMIGRTYTATTATAGSPATAAAFQEAEDQAGVTNASLAVIAQLAGSEAGFWLDFSGTNPLYRQEPGGATFTRAGLLALMTGTRDRMTLVSTPLGSERRVAAPSGVSTVPTGPAPSSLQLMGMVPNTAYTDIPSLSLLWDTGFPGANGTNGHTTRLYQNALLIDGPAGGYGLCSIRHEAARRFRVAGQNIRHGATLRLFIQNDPAAGPPVTTLRVDDPGQVQTLELELPLHPTDILLDDLTRVWETAVEMEPRLFYRLMAGRPSGFPGVIDNLTDLDFLIQIVPEAQPPGTWSPAAWNNQWVRVINADGTQGDGGWQALTLEPGPDCP